MAEGHNILKVPRNIEMVILALPPPSFVSWIGFGRRGNIKLLPGDRSSQLIKYFQDTLESFAGPMGQQYISN